MGVGTQGTDAVNLDQLTSLSTSAAAAIGIVASKAESLSTGLGAANNGVLSLSTSTSTGLSAVTSGVSSLSTGLNATNNTVSNLSTSTSTGLSTVTSGVGSLSTGLGNTNTNVSNLSTSVNNIYNTGTKYFHANSTATDADVSGKEAVAIGPKTVASGANSFAAGNGAKATAGGGIAVGFGARATGDNAIAIGTGSLATGSQAFGINSRAGGGGAALGDGADAGGTELSQAKTVSKGTAIGFGAVVQQSGGVALGAGSVASRAAGVAGYVPVEATADQQAAVAATTSTQAAVSVGDATNGQHRQITGVGAGSADSDAANVAQLKAASSAAKASSAQYATNPDGTINYNQITLGNGQAPGGTRISNVAPGVQGTDAVNVNQLAGAVQQSNQYTDRRAAELQNNIGNVAKKAYSGVAAAMAMESAPYVAGKVTYAAGLGHYANQSAIALSLRKTMADGRWSITGGVSATASGGVAARVGVSGVWE